MGKIIIALAGPLIIIFIIWFFFGKREKATKIKEIEGIQEIEIIVDGGYNPSTIEVKKDIPTRLNFNRKDPFFTNVGII